MSLFRTNFNAGKLFSLLGKDAFDFGRFRDIYLQDDYIVVLARVGGGNRAYCQDVFNEMQNHPWYDYDEDDGFDETYAYFYFLVPDDVMEKVVSHLKKGLVSDEEWEKLNT